MNYPLDERPLIKTIKGDISQCHIAIIDWPFAFGHSQYDPFRRNFIAFYYHDLLRPFEVHRNVRDSQLRIFKSLERAVDTVHDRKHHKSVFMSHVVTVMTNTHPQYDMFLSRAILMLDRLFPELMEQQAESA